MKIQHDSPPDDLIVSAHRLLAFGTQDVLRVEVGSDGGAAYRAGHIPGAVYLDTNALERPPEWNRLPDAELGPTLAAHGISAGRRVVLYGRSTAAAARAAAILHYTGVSDLQILDGGFAAWQRAAGPIESGQKVVDPVDSFGRLVPGRPGVFVDMQALRQRLEAPDSVLVSIRSLPEFLGETSGYDFIRPRGHIPGAVWGGGGSDKDHLEDFVHPDWTARDPGEIESRWNAAGIDRTKDVIFYCGTGWRASVAYWSAYRLNWPRISIFDGGWLEWSGNPDNPLASGAARG